MNTSAVRVATEVTLLPLRNLAQPVEQLYFTGPLLELLHKPRIAIVGSRKVTPYGRAVTIKLASDLARAGVVIVSGLAIGVDSIAHKAACDAGGLTIAVLPRNLDRIYPTHHTHLAQEIVQKGGVLVTEHPAGSGSPMKHQFIARNRIIAALSQGLLITEAASRSGSLHTANFALEQGLDVFAVPGNITSELSAGTNNLIKTGATPVTEVQDIIDVLGIAPQQQVLFQAASKHEETVFNLIKQGTGSLSELAMKAVLPVNELQNILTSLEIAGVAKQTPAGAWYCT